MPLYIPVEETQKGMRLAETFAFMGRSMLSAGKVLSDSDVTKLRKRFAGVYVRVADPILDDLIEFEDDTHERSRARQVQTKVVQCLASVEQRLSCRTSLDSAIFDDARDAIDSLITHLTENPVTAALLDQHFDTTGYLAKHAGNVFYLSLVLAAAAQSYVLKNRSRQTISTAVATDLVPLGLGAMFIDLGLYPQRELFEKPSKLTEEDRQAFLQHPITGVNLLPEGFPAAAKMIIRTHHENCAGQGYPNKIEREKLHVFSRIVRIADAYDSAISTNIYRNGKSPAFALWAMQSGPYKRFYDPALMTIFATLIQPFPIGARLRLMDGRQAIVTKYNRKLPFQPFVIVALAADGSRLRESQILGPLPLDRRSGLQIASYNGEDMSFIYEMPGIALKARPLFNDTHDDDNDRLTLFEMMFP